MEPYDEDQLLLITSVIYSETFELTGGRKQEVFTLQRHGMRKLLITFFDKDLDVLSSFLNLGLSNKVNSRV